MTPQPGPQPWPTPAAAWSAVGLFSVAAILSYTDRQILSLLVDPIRAELNVSDTQIGILQGVAFALIYSFAGLPLGRLADLVQRRWVILAGNALWSAGTILCGYAGSFWALFGGRVIVGIGEAALAPAAFSMISDMFPAERRGLAIGVFVMGMAVGGGVAIAIGGAVLGLVSSGAFAGVPMLRDLSAWRAVLVLLGASGIPLLLLLALVREPARRDDAASDGPQPGLSSIFTQLRAIRGALIPLVLGCACMSVGDFAMLSWSPALLTRRYLLSSESVGLTLGPLIIASGVLASLGAGAISDALARRYGPAGRLRLAAGSALCASPFALVTLTGSAHQLLAVVTLWLLFSTSAGLAGITALQEIVPNRARGLCGSFIAFGNIILGLGVGATLTGYLTDHVFEDRLAIGRSLTLIILPACVIAIGLFLLGARNARIINRGA